VYSYIDACFLLETNDYDNDDDDDDDDDDDLVCQWQEPGSGRNSTATIATLRRICFRFLLFNR